MRSVEPDGVKQLAFATSARTCDEKQCLGCDLSIGSATQFLAQGFPSTPLIIMSLELLVAHAVCPTRL